jgi:hypothetical protein
VYLESVESLVCGRIRAIEREKAVLHQGKKRELLCVGGRKTATRSWDRKKRKSVAGVAGVAAAASHPSRK